MAYTKEDIKKRMQQREEKPSLSSSAKMTKDDVKKRLAQREFNALGSSVSNANNTLSKALGGWNDAASMQNYRGTIQGASDSINDYINKYASTMDVETRSGLNKIANTYSNALNSWDDTTALYGHYKNADAFNSAMEIAKQNASKPSVFDSKYRNLVNNADFNEKSTIDDYGTKTNIFGITNLDWNNKDSISRADFNRNLGGPGLAIRDMDDADVRKKVGQYIFNTQGKDAYNQYMSDIQEEYGKDKYEADAEKAQAYALEHPVASILKNNFENLLLGPASYGQINEQKIAFGKSDKNYGANAKLALNREEEAALIKHAEEKYPNAELLGYNVAGVGMKALTSGISSRIGQSIFDKGYNVIMGMGAFASTYQDAKERGLDEVHALTTAFIAGGVEWATEQLGMEWAFGDGGKIFITNLLKQAGAEGAEELVGDFLNNAFDLAYNGSDSELLQEYDDMIARGFTESEARAEVAKNYVKNTVEGAIVAAISTVPQGTVHGARVANAGSQIDSEMLAQYAQNKGGETYDLYKDYIDNAKLSNWQKGNIYGAYVNENRQDLKAAAEARDVDKFMQADDDTTVLKSMQKTKTKTDFKTTKKGEGIKATDVVNEDGRTYAVDPEGVMHDLSEEAVTVSQAVLYENASAIEDEDVRKLYLDYEGQDVDGYTRNFDLAYEMAARGIPLKEIQESVNFNAISSEKVTAIYEKSSNIKFRNSVEARKAMDIKMAKWSGEYRPGKLDTSSIDMNSLSKTEKSMVKFLELFSKMGMNIKVVSDDSEVPDGDTLGNQITINLKARYWKKSRAVEGKYAYSTFAHESTHWMSNILGAEFDTFKAVVQQTIGMRKWNDFVALEINNANYDDEGNLVPEDQRISQEIAEEEAIARICEDMLNDPKAVERILASASDSQIQRLINAVKSWFENIKKDIEELLKGYSSVSTEAQYLKGMEEQFKTIQDAWVEMFERALKANQALVEESMEALQANDTAHAEEVLGFEVKATPKNSLKLDDSLGEKSIKANNTNVDPATKEKKMNVDPRVLTNSIAQRKGIARALRALERFLPEDIEGNALTKNGSYGRSVEHALICVRSLVNNWFVDKVANEIGRPLTAEEQIVASEILAGKVGNQRECQYCYVAADRRSYKATFKKYLDDYNDLRSKAINNKEAYANELDYLTKNYSRFKDQFKVKDTRAEFAKKEAKNIPGLTEYLAGRAPTVNMLDRYMHIVSDAVNGVAAIDPKRFSTETIRQLHRNDKALGWYVKDATSYAKAATKAKLTYRDIKVKGKKMRLEYVAYNGNILSMKPELINHLNSEYGLRLYSDSDYVPAFLLEDMQIVTDAAVKGLKMLAYTKDMGFAKVFAPTGMNINISTYGVLDEAINNDKEFEKAKAEYLIDQNDKTRKAYLDALSKYVVYDGMQGADWNETKDLRKEYENISAIFVATNDDLVEWAMAQDWIDVVIPYHTVFAGLETKEYFKYSNYKDIQGDRKAKGWQDGDLKSIPPTIHGNDLEKYKQALKDNHLTARFAKWENNPNYMKLVNETRLPYTESQPVQPEFDWDAAEAEIARIAVEGKYGFGQGMNSEEDQERLFGEDAKKAVKLIASGKISRQDVDDFLSGKMKLARKVDEAKMDADYMAAVNAGDMKEAQKMVNAAARRAGYNHKVYHGTGRGGFTVFNTKENDNNMGSHFGSKAIAKGFASGEFGGGGDNPKVYGVFIKAKNPFETYDWFGQDDYYPAGIALKLADEIGTKEAYDIIDDIMALDEGLKEEMYNMIDAHGYFPNDSGYLTSEQSEVLYSGLRKLLKMAGYDSIHYENGLEMDEWDWIIQDPENIKSADPITYDDNGNIIPLSERFKTDNPDIRYANKVMDGYSEVVPGRLGLTDERIDKLLSGGYYGASNPNYAQAYMAYMSPEEFLKLTTGKNQRALERIKNWESSEDFSIDKMADKWNYQPIQLNIDEETNEVIGHEGRHRMWQLQQMGYNQIPVMLFNSENKYSKQKLDSIDLMPQWFQSLDDDLNDSDRVTIKDLIPFSQGNRDLIKEKFGSGSKSEVKFANKVDSDAELNKKLNLIAVHGTRQDKLLKALKLEGLPALSTAIINIDDGLANEDYGEISLVFDKATIDPARSGNSVYGADIWSPTSSGASVERQIDNNAIRDFDEYIKNLSSKFMNGLFAEGSHLGGMLSAGGDYTSEDPESVSWRFDRNNAMMAAYLASKGIELDPIMKPKNYNSVFSNNALEMIIDAFRDEVNPNTFSDELLDMFVHAENYSLTEQEKEKFASVIKDVIIKDRGMKPELADKLAHNRYSDDREVYNLLYSVLKYEQDGKPKTEEADKAKTSDMIYEEVHKDMDAYRKWIQSKIEEYNVFTGEEGLYNKQDRFTANGRKSFKQTHVPITAANIVKLMDKEESRGLGYAGHGAEGIQALTAKKYASIDEIRSDKGRLSKLGDEEYKQLMKEYDEKLNDLAREIQEESGVSYYTVSEAFKDAAKGSRTSASIKKAYREYDISISDDLVKRSQALYKEVSQIPSKYFEAKAQRVIGFDEIKMAVIPDDSSKELVSALDDKGIPHTEYKAGDNQERVNIIRGFDNIKFAKKVDVQLTASEMQSRADIKEVLEQIEGGNFAYTIDKQIAVRSGNEIVYVGGTGKRLVVNSIVRIDADTSVNIGTMNAQEYALEALMHCEAELLKEGKEIGERELYYQTFERRMSSWLSTDVTIRRLFRPNVVSIKEFWTQTRYTGGGSMESLAEDILFRGIYNNDASSNSTIPSVKNSIEYYAGWDRKSFAKKVNDPDIFGQNKRLETENEKLKADVERLKNRLKIERVYTKGKMLDDHKIELAARVILKEARSNYDEKMLAEGLKDVYQYIVDNSNGEILWDEIMNKAAVVARKVLDASKPEKITDDYFKGILREIRAAKIKLTDEQIQEVKSWYGDDWRRDFLGKIMLVKEGRSLDSYWSEWSSMHPDVFDPNTNPNDQVTAILDIYDEMKELSTEYVKYNDNESVRALAIEIYNKFWNVPTVTTLTDKHKAEINKLKADHKQAIKELKDSNTSELAKQKQDQKLADDIYYGKKISKEKEFYQNAIKKVRADKDRRFNQYKEYKKDQQAKMRDAIARKKLVDKIMVTSKTLFKWIDENSKDHHIPKAMLPVVKQLLGSIDFSSKQLLGLRGGSKAGMPTKSDVSFREAMDRLRNLIIQSSTEEGMAELGGYIDFPADYQARINTLCDEINKTAAKIGADNIYIINEMNVDDLTDLYDIVKTIKHLVQTMNVTIAGANKVKISDTARNTINYSNKLGDKKNRSKLNAMFEFSNSLPIYTFERMGEGAMRMFEGVQDGWDKFAFNIKKVINDAKGMFNSQQEKDWTEHSQEVTLMILPTEQEMKEGAEPHEEKVRITDAQIMSLYCLSKRDHAIQHMYNGGICIAEFDDKTHKVVQSRNYRLNAAEVNKLIGLLSKEQIEVADKIQNYMNTVCKDWGNEVSMKRYGIEGFKEENYFPIKVDQNGLPVNAQDREKSVYALLNMGFTKPINPRAKNPIEIGNIFDVFTIHASEMAKYNSIALPVLDMVKWFSFTEKQGTDIVGTRKSLLQAFGKDANTYIRHFLNDLNGMQESGRGEGVMKKLTRSYKTAAVAANMQVMALQPISILRATAVMDEKYILKGMANVGKIKYGMEMCQKYSGIAVWKSLSLFDTNVSRGIDAQIRQNANLKDKAIELSMKGAEMADEITWGAIWNACEYETRAKNKGLEGEALYQATAKRFRDVVYRTQVVDSTMTRTDVMRSSNLAAQWATSFMSEPSVTMNLFQNMIYKYLQDRREVGYKEAVRRNKRNILKVGEAFLLTSIVEAALRGAFSKVRHPEDDEEYLELLWSEFKQNLNLANDIPIVKDVINEIQGYDVRRPDVESVRNAVKAINGFAKNGITYKNLYKAAQSVSQLTGIPISSAMREFVAMLELLTDIEVDK